MVKLAVKEQLALSFLKKMTLVVFQYVVTRGGFRVVARGGKWWYGTWPKVPSGNKCGLSYSDL